MAPTVYAMLVLLATASLGRGAEVASEDESEGRFYISEGQLFTLGSVNVNVLAFYVLGTLIFLALFALYNSGDPAAAKSYIQPNYAQAPQRYEQRQNIHRILEKAHNQYQ